MRSHFRRCAVFAATLSLVVLAAPPPVMADTDPCSLVPVAQAAALSGGSGNGDWHHHIGNNRYSQETCQYPGPASTALMVAVHLDPSGFANAKMMTKTLEGVGDDAFYIPGVIGFMRHRTYVSMSWGGDAANAAPSPAFLAAAKAAASKL